MLLSEVGQLSCFCQEQVGENIAAVSPDLGWYAPLEQPRQRSSHQGAKVPFSGVPGILREPCTHGNFS